MNIKTIKLKNCNYEHKGYLLKKYENHIAIMLNVYPSSKNPYEEFFINQNEIEYII